MKSEQLPPHFLSPCLSALLPSPFFAFVCLNLCGLCFVVSCPSLSACVSCFGARATVQPGYHSRTVTTQEFPDLENVYL